MKNKNIKKGTYWETHSAKEAFERLVPHSERIRSSLNRMEQEGRQDRIKEIEYQKKRH